MAHFPHLGPPLDLSRDLDLLAILVVSPFGDGDRTIRVVDLGRSGEGHAWYTGDFSAYGQRRSVCEFAVG
jgi:hypothetical protein